jgi:CBS domain containing-hemolysin-like protein
LDSVLSGLISLILLLVLSAFFSAAHAALTNVRRHHLREQAERGNDRARFALKIAEQSSDVLATFQLANLLTYFLIAGILALLFRTADSESLVSMTGIQTEQAFWLFTTIDLLAAGVVVYLFVELIPASLGQRFAEDTAIALAWPAQITIWIFLPLSRLIGGVRRWLVTSDGASGDGAFVTEEEIKTLVDAGQEEGAIEQEEKEMIYSIFQLDETMARDIMLPRVDMVALDITTSVDTAVKVIGESGHSRIPVYEESLDHIKGLLYAKDLLNLWESRTTSADLRKLLRPVIYVPETKKVLDLLRELQKANVHMAIAIDEYGGTAGLVTIEDIVEEVVGEIRDEYDQAEEAPYEQVGDGAYVFDARVSLDDVNELLGVALSDELADTLGGFVYGHLGKVPNQDETLEVNQVRLKVLQVEDQRIMKIHALLLPKSGEAPTKGGHDHGNNSSGR